MPRSNHKRSKFDNDLDWSAIYEQEVVDMFEHNGSIEVKAERDTWLRTGNHAVELYRIHKDSGKKESSGLYITDAYWWNISLVKDNLTRRVIIIKVKELKALVKKLLKENKYKIIPMGDKDSKFTTYGVLIPINEIMDFENINDYKEY